MSAEMTTIGRVQVRRWPAEGPARLVVLVHGYGEHIGRYEHVAEALAARGSTVVGPDHVGHGRSAGGLIAARYARRNREDLAGLVLSGPAVGLAPVFEDWLAAPEPPSDPID